jgi:Mor family transcriptional regulator
LEKDNVYGELKEIVGEDAAKRMVEHYSGSNLYFPQGILLKLRHKKIIKEFKHGTSYKELAVRYGYTERHIRNIVHNGGSDY